MTKPYVMPGLEVAAPMGRQAILERARRDLTKLTPDHVSIIGPRYFGKTTLVRALAKHFSTPDSYYQLVCYQDLRYDTPSDDAAFKAVIAKRMSKGLIALGRTEFHEYLDPQKHDGATIGGMIEEVIGAVASEGLRILIVLDDFDKVAQETQITKNLWDYLRSLAQRSNVRFVTTSRKGLRELILSRESLTSDFWNIFGSRIVLPPFDARTLDDVLQPMAEGGYTIEEGARKELLNWTGGVPVLVSGLCRGLMDSYQPCAVSKDKVDIVAEALLRNERDILAAMWEDCPQVIQSDLIDLNANRDHANGLADKRRRILIDRGYVVAQGDKYRPSCRLISRYAMDQEGAARDIREMFKDEESEQRNMRRILEIKLASIEGADGGIREFVSHAIAGLAIGDRAALLAIRSIAEEAVAIAWQAEFRDNAIPLDAVRELTRPWAAGGGGLAPGDLSDLNDINTRRRILRLATGQHKRKKLTQFISRPTMLLIDHLHNVGDYGQHLNSIPPERERAVDSGFCAAACLSAIALLKRITEDLAPSRSGP